MREETAAGVRYRMLDTVRAYGADWLAATGRHGRLRRRHRDWYLGLATWCELDWFSPAAGRGGRAGRERSCPICAARWSTVWRAGRGASGRSTSRARCGSSGSAAAASRRGGTGWTQRRWRLETPDDPSRLKALWVLGYVAILQGDTVRRARRAARVPGGGGTDRRRDGAGVRGAPHGLSGAASRTTWPRAEELLRTALGALPGDRRAEQQCADGPGRAGDGAWRSAGDLAGRGARCARRSGEVCEDHGERWALAYALYVLAYAQPGAGASRRAPGSCCGSPWPSATPSTTCSGSVLAMELLALVTAVEGRPGGGGGAAGRRGADLAVGGAAAVRLGVLRTRRRAGASGWRGEQLGDARYESGACGPGRSWSRTRRWHGRWRAGPWPSGA